MKWFNYLAWDIISDLAFGEAVRFVGRVRLISTISWLVLHLSYFDQGTDWTEVKTPGGGMYAEEAIHVVDNVSHSTSMACYTRDD